LQDLGFLAFTLPHVEILMPTKKPRGEELTREQHRVNQALHHRRLRIEHVHSSVKRCHIELVASFQECRCYARWPWWTPRAADESGAVRKMCGTLRQNVGRYARDRWRFSPHASEVCLPYKHVFSPYTSMG
jgi:hypothetical protein